MKEFNYVVTRPDGLATRGGTALVNTASGFTSAVSMRAGGVCISAKSLLGVMLMPTRAGDELGFSVEGPDEDAAAEAILACLRLYL